MPAWKMGNDTMSAPLLAYRFDSYHNCSPPLSSLQQLLVLSCHQGIGFPILFLLLRALFLQRQFTVFPRFEGQTIYPLSC